jgi:hypothetical protein
MADTEPCRADDETDDDSEGEVARVRDIRQSAGALTRAGGAGGAGGGEPLFGASPADPRRPADARWQRAGWEAPPRAGEGEEGDLLLTVASVVASVGMFMRIEPAAWAGIALSLLSLGGAAGGRRVREWKWSSFLTAFTMGVAGVFICYMQAGLSPEQRAAQAAAEAARPNFVASTLKAVGLEGPLQYLGIKI